MSRMMRAPVRAGASTAAGADEAVGSTISSRSSDGLMTDDPNTNTTADTGAERNMFSRSAKTAGGASVQGGIADACNKRYFGIMTATGCICSSQEADGLEILTNLQQQSNQRLCAVNDNPRANLLAPAQNDRLLNRGPFLHGGCR